MKDKKKHTGKAKLNRIVTVLFLCVFLFSLYKAGNILLEYYNINRFYDETLSQYASGTDSLLPDVDLKALRKVNKDVIGWIYIPDTNISFPILKVEMPTSPIFL